MDGLQEKGLLRLLIMTMARIVLICLFCLAARGAMAGEPGKGLEMNDITSVLREAEGQARKMPPPINERMKVGESAAGEVMEQFNAPPYQAKIRQEQQRLRETVFQSATGEAMTTPEPEAASGERLYLFISSSVQLSTLRAYAAMIDRARASQVTMVLRGFVAGMKRAGPTMAFIGEVLKKDPACDLGRARCESYQVNIQIDPERFQRFGIEQVPALTYLAEGSDGQGQGEPLIVSGDASLDTLLERINREAKRASLQTMIAALRHGGDKGECQ